MFKLGNYLNYFFSIIDIKTRIGVKGLSGRNNQGTICIRHRLGVVKNNYTYIDFFRRINSFGTVYKLLKITLKTAFLGGVIYDNGLFSFISLSEGVKIGQRVYSGIYLKKLYKGSTYLLDKMPLFTLISGVEFYPKKGFSLSRSAGSSTLITVKTRNVVGLKFKSGWNIYVPFLGLASYGSVSNKEHKLKKLGKAGKSWSLGFKSGVRGVAMNPCDHPHGGGNGKKSPLAAPKSPWGWLTKGTPSLKKKFHLKKKFTLKKIK